MNTDTLASLLGKCSTDSQVEATLQHFGVTRRPELIIDPYDADGPVVKSQDWVSNLSIGIEFGFQEEGAFSGLDQSECGVGSMILTEVYFYGERPGGKSYPLPLPFGLLFEDNRSIVRTKLAIYEKTRRSYVRDTWEHPAFRMTVSYTDEGTRIDFIVCMLRSEALQHFEGTKVALPSVAIMIEQLGKRIDDPIFRQIFVPLGMDQNASNTWQTIDLRKICGLILSIRKMLSEHNLTAKVPVLYAIEFLRELELGSHGWHGELPFNICFDDSPEMVLNKVPYAPAHQEDQDFSGYVFWDLSNYSLQVVYSTMENVVLRVNIFASVR